MLKCGILRKLISFSLFFLVKMITILDKEILGPRATHFVSNFGIQEVHDEQESAV